jgi:carbamoyl-phosphate synthase large subunit
LRNKKAAMAANLAAGAQRGLAAPAQRRAAGTWRIPLPATNGASPAPRQASPAVANKLGSSSTRRASVVTCAAPASALPWQAAMSEVKKRSDIKSIMIIGA